MKSIANNIEEVVLKKISISLVNELQSFMSGYSSGNIRYTYQDLEDYLMSQFAVPVLTISNINISCSEFVFLTDLNYELSEEHDYPKCASCSGVDAFVSVGHMIYMMAYNLIEESKDKLIKALATKCVDYTQVFIV